MATIKEIREGLEILSKYVEDEGEQDFFAEHDQIWAGDMIIGISDEDQKRLDELNWFWDDAGLYLRI